VEAAKLGIETHWADADAALPFPDESFDVVVAGELLEHIRDPGGLVDEAARVLRPGGRIVNIDYHKRETPVGPPLDHRLARETFLEEARAAGLGVAREETFLPYQYFLILKPVR